MLPPPQKRMSFLLRLLVHLVPEYPVNLLLNDGERATPSSLGAPDLEFRLQPPSRSAGSVLKPFSFGWSWVSQMGQPGSLPCPHCSYSPAPLSGIGLNTSKLPSPPGRAFGDTDGLEEACGISVEVALCGPLVARHGKAFVVEGYGSE